MSAPPQLSMQDQAMTTCPDDLNPVSELSNFNLKSGRLVINNRKCMNLNYFKVLMLNGSKKKHQCFIVNQ